MSTLFRRNAFHRAVSDLSEDLNKWGFRVSLSVGLVITPTGKHITFDPYTSRRDVRATLRRYIRPYEEGEKAQEIRKQEGYQKSLPTLL